MRLFRTVLVVAGAVLGRWLLLSAKIWLDKPSYNDTMVFQSGNPYDFGIYRGRWASSSIVTVIEAHGPEYIFVPEDDAWYITRAG